MPTQPTDPCTQYEDAQGNVDILALIEGTIVLAQCIIKEATAVAGGAGTLVAHGAQLAISQLRAAKAAHLAAKPNPPNT